MMERSAPQRLAAFAGAAALCLIGVGCGANDGTGVRTTADEPPVVQAKPVAVPGAEKSVPVEFLVDGEDVWLRTLGPPYIWRIDEEDPGAKPANLSGLVDEVAVGNGRLWATTVDAATSQRSIALVIGPELRATTKKVLPTGCEPVGGTVFGDEYWVYCGNSLLAYGVEAEAAIRQIEDVQPAPLLAVDNGLWRVSRTEVTALAGASTATSWPLRHSSAVKWTASGHYAWALDEADSGSLLVRLDLATGEELTFPLAMGRFFPLDLEPVGSEIWVTTNTPTVLRFDPERSPQPIGEVAFGRSGSDLPSNVHLSAGEGSVWVVAQVGNDVETYKLPTP